MIKWCKKYNAWCFQIIEEPECDEVCEGCEDCKEILPDERKTKDDEKPEMVKISFYDLARAIEYLSEHYGVDDTDYLVEELNDRPNYALNIEYDGLLIDCTISSPEEGSN